MKEYLEKIILPHINKKCEDLKLVKNCLSEDAVRPLRVINKVG